MNLYLLRQEVEDCSEGSDFHYNSLLNYPGMIVIDTLEEFPFDGYFFQNVNTINKDTSCIFDPRYYDPSYLINTISDSDKYLLLNNDMTTVMYDPEGSHQGFIRDKVFVKPLKTLKAFSPTCLNPGDRLTSLGLKEPQPIAVFPFKDLTGSTEFRSVIVENEIISIVNTENETPVTHDMFLFVEKMNKKYEEVDTYVLDFLLWRGMLFVVEINPLETSGFFGNYQIILDALKNVKG